MTLSSWSDLDSDSALIERCLQGQEAAWEALLYRYERLIYATCHRYNLQIAEADDVFGRVSLLLLQSLAVLRDRNRLAAWLITTTSRECWYIKKQHLRTTSFAQIAANNENTFQLEELTDTAPLPEEELLQLELLQDVREALGNLSERCQQLLWHLFYNPAKPSYNEIALELKMPISSIGPNRARCLDKLRLELQKKQSK